MVDLELKRLDSFYGSDRFYGFMGLFVTEGVKYVMDNGYGWLVSDIAVNIRFNPSLRRYFRNDYFLVIRLTVDKENNTGVVTYEDGNDNIIYRQKYGYTDAKRNITLYYDANSKTLCLSSEY